MEVKLQGVDVLCPVNLFLNGNKTEQNCLQGKVGIDQLRRSSPAEGRLVYLSDAFNDHRDEITRDWAEMAVWPAAQTDGL